MRFKARKRTDAGTEPVRCDAPDCEYVAVVRVKNQGQVQYLCQRHRRAMADYYDAEWNGPYPNVEVL